MAVRRAHYQESGIDTNRELRIGSLLVGVVGLALAGYGVAFLAALLASRGSVYEFGVDVLDGLTLAELASTHPEVAHYITHIHFILAGFFIGTGIVIMALAWYGIRAGKRWALATAVMGVFITAGSSLPLHFTGGFSYDMMMHLGPVYVLLFVFVVGIVLAYRGLQASTREA